MKLKPTREQFTAYPWPKRYRAALDRHPNKKFADIRFEQFLDLAMQDKVTPHVLHYRIYWESICARRDMAAETSGFQQHIELRELAAAQPRMASQLGIEDIKALSMADALLAISILKTDAQGELV